DPGAFDLPAAAVDVVIDVPQVVRHPARAAGGKLEVGIFDAEHRTDHRQVGARDEIERRDIDLIGTRQVLRDVRLGETVAGARNPGPAGTFRELQVTAALIEVADPGAADLRLEAGPGTGDVRGETDRGLVERRGRGGRVQGFLERHETPERAGIVALHHLG